MRIWIFLTLCVNAVIVASLGSFGAFVAHEQVAQQEQELQNDVKNLASTLASAALNDVLLGNLDKIELLLKRTAAIERIAGISIRDPDGRTMSAVARNAAGNLQIVFDAPATDVSSTTEYRWTEPIRNDRIVGWVSIATSLKELDLLRQRIWRSTMIAIALAACLASTVILLIMRGVGRQIYAATAFAGRLSQQKGGSLAGRSPFPELQGLRESLNQTSALLDRQFRELHDNQVRYRTMLEASVDCLVTTSRFGRIVDWNTAAETTFGYSRSEAIGQPVGTVVIPPDRQSEYEALLTRWRESGGQDELLRQRLKIEMVRRDGSRFPAEVTVAPFELGGELYFLGSIQDISKRRALQEAHRETAAQLQATVHELRALKVALDQHAIVSIGDLQGTILYANDKFCELSGYTREELIGQNHRLINSGKHPAAFFAHMWETISRGLVWHGEIINRRKTGELYWVTSTIVPVLDDHCLPTRYISVRTDITVLKLTEQALAVARQRELAIGNQIQRTLLSGEAKDASGTLAVAIHTDPSTGIDGDFYDFFSHRCDEVDVVVGDVMGKGVTAALIGAAVKQQLNRVLAEHFAADTARNGIPRPAEVMNGLHRAVTPRLIALDTFVTMTYMRFNPHNHSLTFVGAGHPSAILAGDHGIRFLTGENLPLGVIEDETYCERSVELTPGDIVFLYSDGLTEARNSAGDEFGVERLGILVATLNAERVPGGILIQAVRKAVLDFEHDNSIRDDRTCITLQQNAFCSIAIKPQILELPWDLASLTPLRKAIETIADTAGLESEARDALVLAAFEAATNIIRHGGERPFPDCTVHCRVEDEGDAVSITLHYLGPPFIPKEDTTPDFSGGSEGGFGLFIIRSCVDQLEYDSPAPDVCRIHMRKNKQPLLPA